MKLEKGQSYTYNGRTYTDEVPDSVIDEVKKNSEPKIEKDPPADEGEK